jgi:N-acetylmuramoyl-L-alanine amidase
MKRSIKISKLLLLSAFLFVPLLSFSQGNFIRLVDTDGDTARIQGVKLRYSGSTLPGSVLKINNTPIKVYPSGAFAVFLEYKPGLNKVDLVSENPEHGIASKTIWVECNVPVPEKTTTGFAIDYVRLVPDQDQCLVTGDVVSVKVKAQPGNIVRVEGKRLFELPDSVTGGVAGIYQGQYIISATDTFKLAGVKAEMTNSEGEKTTATSKSLLSINSREFNRFALTTGKMPALYMGLGTDRLGGAKFGYLDTAVVVKVTGRTGDMDRVRLADGEIAWINKTNIALLPEGYILPVPVLSSSFMISGNDDFDYVKMYIPERVPYTSNLEINPDRIELDIYGVTSNTNWITQLNSAKEVKNVYYRQVSHDVLRVIIELNHKQAWGYSVYYENRYLVVRVKHQPEKLKLSDLTIALDAGHGGSSDGAWGSTGLLEKNVNLQIVEKIKKALEKRGAKVILTRSDDSDIYTIDRWLSLVPKNPDILLSIHNNSIGNSDPLASKGVSTYYKYIGFRPLSVCMYNELLKCGLSENGNTGSFNFTLNSPTEFVNALIEVAFMSYPEDEMKLMDDKFLDRIADHVLAGLDDFLREAGR